MINRNFSGRERMLITATLLTAVLAGAYIFVWEPLYGRWRGLDEDMAKKRHTLIRAKRVLTAREPIEARYDAYRKFFRDTAMSEEEMSASMLGVIERLGRGASVAIINMKPMDTKHTDQYMKFTIRISTESSLSGLVKFVYDLQSSDQLLKVERMTLRAKERQRDTIRGTLHITKINLTN